MNKYDVYGVGNALVDSEYEVHDGFLSDSGIRKGTMALVSVDERLSLLRALESREHRIVKQAGGGSAANTIVAVSQLGGKTYYTCKVARDSIGDFFLADLAKAGVETNMSFDAADREEGHTGQCISMVTPDAERTMATHLGITEEVSADDLDIEAIKNSTYVYIEGYLVTSPTSFKAAQKAISIARSADVRVALTLSDPAMVENFKPKFDSLINAGVDLLFCNREEAQLWSETDSSDAAIAKLKSKVPTFALTLGSSGSVVFDGSPHNIAPVATKAVDTTGAGDMFAGAFLSGITRGMSFSEAGSLGSKAASVLVSSFGARLDQETVDQHLKQELN